MDMLYCWQQEPLREGKRYCIDHDPECTLNSHIVWATVIPSRKINMDHMNFQPIKLRFRISVDRINYFLGNGCGGIINFMVLLT